MRPTSAGYEETFIVASDRAAVVDDPPFRNPPPPVRIARRVLAAAAAPVVAALLAPALYAVPAPSASAAVRQAPLPVAASIAPAAYLVDRLAGPLATTTVMVPTGAEEETWSPTPRQLAALLAARVYVAVGHPAFVFESRDLLPLLRIHPEIRLISMAQGVDPLPMGPPPHGGTASSDPHIWLAPAPMAAAARSVAAALVAVDPAHSAIYAANLRRLEQDLLVLDTAFRRVAAGPQRVRFVSYHPAWGHLAHQYGFEQLAVEADGKDPGTASLVALVAAARSHDVHLVLVPAGLPARLTDSLAAAIRGQVVTVDYMARDWLSMMQRLAVLFAEVAAHGQTHG